MRHQTPHSEMVLMASAAGLCIGGATWLLSEWFHANDAKTNSTNVFESNSDVGKSDKSFFSNLFETKPDSDTGAASVTTGVKLNIENQGNSLLNWFSSDAPKQTENQTPNSQTVTPNAQTSNSQIPNTQTPNAQTSNSQVTPNTQTSNAQTVTDLTPNAQTSNAQTSKAQTVTDLIQNAQQTETESSIPIASEFQTPTTQSIETIVPNMESYFAPQTPTNQAMEPIELNTNYFAPDTSPDFKMAQSSDPFRTAESSDPFQTAQTSPTIQTAQTSGPFKTAETSDPFQTVPFETTFQTVTSPTPSSSAFRTPEPPTSQKGGSRKRRMNKRNTRKRK